MSLPEVTIFGIKYPFLFGVGALLSFKRKYGDVSTSDIMLQMSDLPPEQYDWVVYSAIRAGAGVAGKWFVIPFWVYQLYVKWNPGFYDRLDMLFAEQLPLPESGSKEKKKKESQ